jgi:hypothetical protein
MSELSARTLPAVRTTEIGWSVLKVPYWSHPEFDFQKACIGMEESEIQTELMCNWAASSGLRVYPEFKYEMHVSKQPLEYDPDMPLHISFDWGLSPACAIAQLSSFGQLQIFPSFAPEERQYEGIYSFAERVADHLLTVYAAPYDRNLDDLPLVVIGDPAGRSKQGHSVAGKKSKEEVSCFDILFRGLTLYVGEDENGRPMTEKLPGWGWRAIPGDVSHLKRQEAVRYRLKTLIHGEPAFLIDQREEFLQSCFLGGYHFKQYSDGTYGREPEKNHSSHLVNAVEYLCTRLSARPAQKPDDDEDGPRLPPFVSFASSSRRP